MAQQAINILTASSSRPADLARRYLSLLAVCIGVAVVTGTFLLCYPTTMASLNPALVVLHDVSGDAAVLVSGLYLMVHLPRTWSMKRRAISRWSGFAALAVWIVAAATGVWGQVQDLSAVAALWWAHLISSLATVIIGCFHGVWGYRPRPSINPGSA
jgi:hypothetical protein